MQTKDGIINITIAKDVSEVVFQPADWSMVNIPLNPLAAERLANNLYNMPSHRHISLVVNRRRRKDRVKGLCSLAAFNDRRWRLLDTVSVGYGKPSTSSNNGFLPLTEHGYLFYKGDTPDAKKTNWASEDGIQNATNQWDLCVQPLESVYYIEQTYYQKFAWDLPLIMMSLADKCEHSRFIFGLWINSSPEPKEIRSLYTFCSKFNLTVEIIVSEYDRAEKILAVANQTNKQLIEEVKK